jgi:2-amino-4-hydroxy-6-hydroxymethyldihydropteridine diphosphokinase
MAVIVYLGLGGNLGRPEESIHQAVDLLNAHPLVKVTALSSFYRTEPVGMAAQEGERIPWFVNAAAEILTSLSAPELLAFCLSVEQQLGRVRAQDKEKAGALSRTLDVDLLFYGNEIIHQSGLTVPHPRVHERAFTLLPLREIAPRFCHPALGLTIEALAQRLPDITGVQRLQPLEHCVLAAR